MTQAQLNRAIARVTGETVETIDQRGFGLMTMPPSGRPGEPIRVPTTVERRAKLPSTKQHDATKE